MEATGKVLFVSKKEGVVAISVNGMNFYPEKKKFSPELWERVRKGNRVNVELTVDVDSLQTHIISVS